MAMFDPSVQRMCVRIVYDGAAGAGKTTNVRALSTLLTAHQATEVLSPAEIDGRTVYFDWLMIMGGLIAGFPLMCQVISVPGQTVLTPRRRYLLSTADIVVLVCDSSPSGVKRASDGLRILADVCGERVPLVVQANKQDQADAVTGADLVNQLSLDGTPVIEAIATQSIGVLDTFVAAIRSVARAIQTKSDEQGLNIPVGRAPGADALLSQLRKQELDPEWAAEMFLEEAQAALLTEASSNVSLADASGTRESPPLLPQPDVEAGFIWPADVGRMVLRSLADGYPPDQIVRLDINENARYAVAGHVLRTSRAHRWLDRESARQALVHAARWRMQFDRRLTLETVLVAQPSRDEGWWLWTIQPEMELLSDALRSPGRRASLLEAYAVAVAGMLRTCVRRGLALWLAPSNFGVNQGTLHYLSEMNLAGTHLTFDETIHNLSAALAHLGADAETVLAIVRRELYPSLTEDEITTLTPLIETQAS